MAPLLCIGVYKPCFDLPFGNSAMYFDHGLSNRSHANIADKMSRSEWHGHVAVPSTIPTSAGKERHPQSVDFLSCFKPGSEIPAWTNKYRHYERPSPLNGGFSWWQRENPKRITWKTNLSIPWYSKWPFHSPVGGHRCNHWTGHLTFPKSSQSQNCQAIYVFPFNQL